MLYTKVLNLKTNSRIKLAITNFAGGVETSIDQNITPFKYAKCSYNFNHTSGALKEAPGFSDLTIPTTSTSSLPVRTMIMPGSVNIVAAWIYRFVDDAGDYERIHYLIVYANDKHFYYTRLFSINPELVQLPYIADFDECPTVVNFRVGGIDSLIFTSPSSGMHIWKGWIYPYLLVGAPALSSMCVHYERIWGTLADSQRNTVKFSDDLNPENWTESLNEGGFIQMLDEAGPLNKVISFLDYVYVIRDFGIARITAYAEQTDFAVTQLFVTSGKIFDKTACVCGDRIMFFAQDGLYSFNGLTTKKINTGLENFFISTKNEKSFGAYHNGKYYLACYLEYGDGKVIGCEQTSGYYNNSLIEFDIDENTYTIIRGIDIFTMCSIQDDSASRLAVCFRDQYATRLGQLDDSGTFFGTDTVKRWISPFSDLGYPEHIKIVREIHILAKTDCSITITTDTDAKTFNVIGKNSVTKIRTNIKGSLFKIEFECTGSLAYISNAHIIMDIK
ncbi:MAG: hypothetical protein WCX32_02125 [Clostridia bacterium]|nr:hypothetical protein [Clostridia bacterium]